MNFYVDGVIVILASTSHNILGTDSDRAIRVLDRYLPKWDQNFKRCCKQQLIKLKMIRPLKVII